jgi:hypothetical protein
MRPVASADEQEVTLNDGTRLTKAGKLRHLKTLEDVVKDYFSRPAFVYSGDDPNRSEGHHDPLIDYCKECKTLEEVIARAVAGLRRDGKVFSEGSCLRASSKRNMAKRMLKNKARLRAALGDFDALYDVVKELAPWGIGATTVYNVTCRIAAWKNTHPRLYLYVHAGPLKGWKALTGAKGSVYRVPVDQLPRPFRRVPLHKLEDLLCEYRDLLHPGMIK